MAGSLSITIGQHSDRGRKNTNQDFHGALIPGEPLLSLKGVAVVLADGISSSDVSQVASESAVKSFLTDYYCTSESWSVKTSACRVINATNSWLHAQTRQSQYRHERDRGYVCTLSALIIRSTTAHLFHIGDARIYRLASNSLEQLTEDHRVIISSEQSYLGRALGVNQQVEIDYRIIPVQKGDTFILATDGVYEHVKGRFIADSVQGGAHDLDDAAAAIVREAYQQGSTDNLTVQIVRIDDLSDSNLSDIIKQEPDLPCAPVLDARAMLDGYRIVRGLHASSRSHIYLATDTADGSLVALKTPSIAAEPAQLQRFRMEEWVARRINSPYVLKPRGPSRKRSYLYTVTEFIDGQTLTQWMIDNPKPGLESVRGIVEQIARGLQAFHRMEMLHQDLRPDNVMIDRTGTAKIIDFGSTSISGIADDALEILGTAQYTAPEYFLGEGGTSKSDIFSLGVIAYQMLTGRLPYGAQIAKTRTRAQQRKLKYRPAMDGNREVAGWIDGALQKATHPDPGKRYDELSEFMFDLRHPNKNFIDKPVQPLLQRNPLLFWKVATAILAAAVFVLLYRLQAGR
jgi:serine/threonine protein phosphatase PrpC